MSTSKSTTEPEKVVYIAENIMRWQKWYWEEPAHGCAWGWVKSNHYKSHRDKKKCEAYWAWNPVGDYEYLGRIVKSDCNHWRQVEVEVMKNLPLWKQFMIEINGINTSPLGAIAAYMKASDITRANKLIHAHQTLLHG